MSIVLNEVSCINLDSNHFRWKSSRPFIVLTIFAYKYKLNYSLYPIIKTYTTLFFFHSTDNGVDNRGRFGNSTRFM